MYVYDAVYTNSTEKGSEIKYQPMIFRGVKYIKGASEISYTHTRIFTKALCKYVTLPQIWQYNTAKLVSIVNLIVK